MLQVQKGYSAVSFGSSAGENLQTAGKFALKKYALNQETNDTVERLTKDVYKFSQNSPGDFEDYSAAENVRDMIAIFLRVNTPKVTDKTSLTTALESLKDFLKAKPKFKEPQKDRSLKCAREEALSKFATSNEDDNVVTALTRAINEFINTSNTLHKDFLSSEHVQEDLSTTVNIHDLIALFLRIGTPKITTGELLTQAKEDLENYQEDRSGFKDLIM